jgi:hypothetical protein
MIVIKVELWPKGDESRARELQRVHLANDGSSADGNRGNYRVAVMRRGEKRAPWKHGDRTNEVAKPIRTGQVLEHPRKSQNVMLLVAKAIAATFPEVRKLVGALVIREEEDKRGLLLLVAAAESALDAANALSAPAMSAVRGIAFAAFDVGRNGGLARVGDVADMTPPHDPEEEDFGIAWARTGYQYGHDALENVKLGWELAKGWRP